MMPSTEKGASPVALKAARLPNSQASPGASTIVRSSSSRSRQSVTPKNPGGLGASASNGALSVTQGHAIATDARRRVLDAHHVLDVMTHVDPVERR
jgi:hypothetical protein